MQKLKFLFGIHNHQPLGNFDHVFEELYDRCYLPYFEVLAQYPLLKTTAHFSGCLLEWLKAHRPSYLKVLGGLVESGRLELLSGGFYEPILSSLPEEDAVGQILMMNRFLEEEFGFRPEGLWLTERIWSPQLPAIIAQAGLRYTLVDDTHFYYAGLEEKQMSGYYMTEHAGHAIAVFPISKTLRYSIPFDQPETTLAHLKQFHDEWGFQGITYGDDGEKFGGWPETYQWVYEERYLHRLFEALTEASDWLETATFSEYISCAPPQGRVYLPMASYEEMMEWSLPYEAGLRFRQLKEDLQTAEVDEESTRIFLRGGQWDNFLTKYEESNHLHKRMLWAGRRVRQLTPEQQEASGARRALYRSQCNCAYWHGLFGGLYLNYLRHALYASLIEAENRVEEALPPGRRGVTAESADFNHDGREEWIVRNPALQAFVSPARGGALMELDYRPACFNLSNVLSRKPEVYHQDILMAGTTENHAEGQPESIHKRVRFKEEGLQDKLIYDRLDRYSFMDHCLPSETSFEQFKTNRYQPLAAFAGQPYQAQGELPNSPEDSFRLQLRRQSADPAFPLEVEKTYTIDPDQARVEVRYHLRNPGTLALDFLWVVEHNFSLLAGDAADRAYIVNGAAPEDARLGSEGVLTGIQTLAMRDGYFGFELKMHFSPEEVWRFPVETVSQSEDGFERVYQGSCVAACWRMRLEPGKHNEIKADLDIQKI